ncbi:uncharacterized protein SOCE26_043110 [Sorangium cellulosum]|uniref:Uncharacterized protein n=1 Tax=Sorangium cellulosum TaxID=56 RepID=A0A2L0EUA6_SORCE|nr:hypothetical protein [Sorangium cellulosum]AUX42874.1 uncharacterized protein SOCE26_043110 [Sorangium cellulosum]
MGSTRTAWHILFAALLVQRGSRRFEVRREVPLSTEPLRVDYLLLRRETEGPTEPVGTLRKLWDLLPMDAIVELKSIGRPYRRRNLDRLFSYLHLYYAEEAERIAQRGDLCGVLLVPSRTRSLDADMADLGLAWDDLGDGYWQLRGGAFALVVAEVDAVAEAEDDDLLRLFGHSEALTLAARRWLSQQIGAKEVAMEIQDLEGFDEVLRKLLASLPPEQVLSAYAPEQRLAGLPPEQRVAGLPPEQVLSAYAPEQRVAGLPPEQVLLALPDEVLHALSDAYLDTLSKETREAIRARIGR